MIDQTTQTETKEKILQLREKYKKALTNKDRKILEIREKYLLKSI